MAFVVNDRVKETTATTGTGTVNLEGAEVGFETFVAGIGNTNTTYYCIQAQGGSAFEIGVGTVTDATPDTLSRTAVISSSNADNLVDFGAGTKDVFCTLPASKAVIEDNSTNADIAGNLTVGGTVDGVDIAARDLILTSTKTTADAALPKAGGQMSGNITMAGTETVDGRDLSVDGTKLDGIATAATAVGGANGVDFNDDVKARFGTGNDFEIYHNGSQTIMDDTGTGSLEVRTNQFSLGTAGGTASMLTATDGGGVSLFNNGTEIAKTTGNGFEIPADNLELRIGASADLKLFHDSNHSVVQDAGTGHLQLSGSQVTVTKADRSASLAAFIDGGAVELYHNGAKKLDTTASGIDVNGSVTATSFSGSLSGNISQFTNNSGYVTSSGVTSVATGNGLSGGTITSTGTLTMSGSFSGNFSASGNITAFSSDSRLKNFKGKIENALDKVDQLNGYYYEWNDVAKGIDAEAFQDGIAVGVNAQEVEGVMPEVVTQAPIVDIHNLDTDYKTVYYDKLVPLLIEAIKELKTEIETLKKDK